MISDSGCLKFLLSQPDFKSELMACARGMQLKDVHFASLSIDVVLAIEMLNSCLDDFGMQVLEPLPTDIQASVATPDTCDLYARTSFFDYPPGMCCLRCYTGQRK